jgi:hypothetical protein
MPQIREIKKFLREQEIEEPREMTLWCVHRPKRKMVDYAFGRVAPLRASLDFACAQSGLQVRNVPWPPAAWSARLASNRA